MNYPFWLAGVFSAVVASVLAQVGLFGSAIFVGLIAVGFFIHSKK